MAACRQAYLVERQQITTWEPPHVSQQVPGQHATTDPEELDAELVATNLKGNLQLQF